MESLVVDMKVPAELDQWSGGNVVMVDIKEKEVVDKITKMAAKLHFSC